MIKEASNNVLWLPWIKLCILLSCETNIDTFLQTCLSWGVELLLSANLSKSSEVSVYCGMVTKHCTFITKIDSPPSENGETPQNFLQWLAIKVHGSVSCGQRSRHVTPRVYWQEEKKCYFHTSVALRSLTQIQPKLLLRCPWTRQIYKPNLKQILPVNPKIQAAKFQNSFFVFSSSCIFYHNVQTHYTPIKLKLGTY